MVRRPTEAAFPLLPGKWGGSHTPQWEEPSEQRGQGHRETACRAGRRNGGWCEQGRGEIRWKRGVYLNYSEVHERVLSRE